jgi:hypothetical protein
MHFNYKEKKKGQFRIINSYVPGSTTNCSTGRILDTSRSLIGAVQYLTLLNEIHKQHCYQPLNQDSKLLLHICWQTKFSEIRSTLFSYEYMSLYWDFYLLLFQTCGGGWVQMWNIVFWRIMHGQYKQSWNVGQWVTWSTSILFKFLSQNSASNLGMKYINIMSSSHLKMEKEQLP